ncbi:MAG TPA: hypothetical protein PLH19_08625 [Anaerolineae bacterium]|nr:hypothetical protein [Anaerolineae bacterium]HQH38580.1 hypothetical protein [Anaerolineae bacterium]
MVERPDVSARVRERVEQDIGKVRRRLEELPNDEEIQQQLQEINLELTQIEAALADSMDGEEGPAANARMQLEVQRERLLAQIERFEMKREMLAEKREHLQETLAELQKSLGQQDPLAASAGLAGTFIPADSRRMHEERRKILQMVQEGKITADEAARLLDALRNQVENTQQRKRKPRWVRIRVTDIEAKRLRVNLTLPVGVVRAGLRVGGNIAGMEGLDTGELEEMLNRGETGYILDMQDPSAGERVEIFVE